MSMPIDVPAFMPSDGTSLSCTVAQPPAEATGTSTPPTTTTASSNRFMGPLLSW